jgi:TolB-like protein
MTRSALVIVVALSSLARAATVAVMPFKVLAGAPSVGEAIRETVTTDLLDVGGLQVIERARIDQVLGEQHLQDSRADLDPLSTVKVGKLLGATLIVTGAYQTQGERARLTARFVKVETGEIVGTAKVDGPALELFSLQDRVTVELIRSAGLAPRHAEKLLKRVRKPLRSVKTIELYGDAVVEKDDARKKVALEKTLAEDPGFVYAARDLEAIEKRVRAYEEVGARAKAQIDREKIAHLVTQTRSEPDATARTEAWLALFRELRLQRRFFALLAAADDAIAHPPPRAPEPEQDVATVALAWKSRAHELLKQDDHALEAGAEYLKRFPTGRDFAGVQGIVERVLKHQHRVTDGARVAADEIARLNDRQRACPCRVGTAYRMNAQLVEARKQLEACLDPRHLAIADGMHHEEAAHQQLFYTLAELGDFAGAWRELDRLRASFPAVYEHVKAWEELLAVDP